MPGRSEELDDIVEVRRRRERHATSRCGSQASSVKPKTQSKSYRVRTIKPSKQVLSSVHIRTRTIKTIPSGKPIRERVQPYMYIYIYIYSFGVHRHCPQLAQPMSDRGHQNCGQLHHAFHHHHHPPRKEGGGEGGSFIYLYIFPLTYWKN